MDRFDDAAFEAANGDARADCPSNIKIVFGEVTSSNGILTKRGRLGVDGELILDGSACWMSEGTLRRVRLSGTPAKVAEAFGRHIDEMASNAAIVIGELYGVEAEVADVVRKAVLAERRKTA